MTRPDEKDMRLPGRRLAPGWPLLAAAVVAAASLLLLYRTHRTEVQARHQVMLERGQMVLDALASGIRAHGRMGRFHQERVWEIFEELAMTPGILGLELRSHDGTVIASTGDTALLTEGPMATPAWAGAYLVMASELEASGWQRRGPPGPPPDQGPGRGMRGGRGMGPRRGRAWEVANWDEWRPFPTGPSRLAVVLDARPMHGQIRRDGLRLAVSAVVCLGGIALGTWVLFAYVRQRNLETALALAQARVTVHERLSQLGAGLAHETKNPLGIVRGLAQSITRAPRADPETKGLARDIIDEADRTVGQINSFLALARPKDPDLASIDLDAFFSALLPLVQAELDAHGVTVDYTPTKRRVLADEDLLRRAVLNILINAARASEAGGTITVTLDGEAGTATITIADRGCGIAPDDLPRVTEPYFTRFESGTGLGLAIVDQIARAHGWDLVIASDLEAGAQVSLQGLREVG